MTRPYVVPLDTTLDAARVYFATLKKLGETRRLEMALDLTGVMRRGVESGVRMRHPAYSDREVRLTVLQLMVGDDLFRKCCPGSGTCPPLQDGAS